MKGLHAREIESASEYLLSTGLIEKSPMEPNQEIYPGVDLYFKREDLQKVKSFKIRWALNAIGLLSDEQRSRWLVCASAGNHAQGFAVACKYFECRGTVFMPEAAPDVKVQATQQFGGEFVEVKLIPGGFDEVKRESEAFTQEHQATYIHPFDDMGVMIGASTIGYEIFQQMQEIGKHIDYIVCPVWGWWLVAGTISAKNIYSPTTTIIGAEPTWHASMKKSLQKWRRSIFSNPHSSRYADGTAVADVWELNFQVAHQDKLHVIDIRKDRLGTYLQKLLQMENPIELEPSGALPVAAIGQEIDTFRGKTVVCILSWANIDDIRRDAISHLAGRHDEYRKDQWKDPV